MNSIASGLLSYKSIFFSFILLSSNQIFFISYHCFLGQTDKIRRWKHMSRSLQRLFFTHTGYLPNCYLGTSFSGLCSSVYLLSKTNTSLSKFLLAFGPAQHLRSAPWNNLTQVYCQLNIMRGLKATQTCCLTHHLCLSTHHIQATLTTYQGIHGSTTCSLFSSSEKKSSTIALPGRRSHTPWDVTRGLRERRMQLVA